MVDDLIQNTPKFENVIFHQKTAKLATLQKLARRSKKMIAGFGISDPKLGKYDTFIGVPKFLTTRRIGQNSFFLKFIRDSFTNFSSMVNSLSIDTY